MKYTEFRDVIATELNAHAAGRTWKELKRGLELPYSQPCPEWIVRLEVEIGLERREKRGNALVWKLTDDDQGGRLSDV